ncbi:MAG: hypothetical protein ACYC61_03335, partial [Isosphaeraceae bacterium]
NMVWWRLDAAGRYRECLVREFADPSDRVDYDEDGNAIDPEDAGGAGEAWRRDYVRYRFWTAEESILFSYDGDRILERVPHRYGRVPIIRLVETPRHRTPNIGKSRYEGIAEYQREYYNRDSELILSDTLQAHPFLSGAEDFCKADNTLSIGPGYVLPKKKNPESGAYEGWEFVSPSKDPAESLRKNKQDIIDLKDRRACLLKPAGLVKGSTTSQSGISKQLDAIAGQKLLASIAKSLAKAERQLAEYALLVLRDRPPDAATREQIRVVYPARFELFAAPEMTSNLLQLQQALAGAGEAPDTEREVLQSIVRQLLLGLSDADYARLDAEIERTVDAKAQIKEKARVLDSPGFTSAVEALEGGGSAEQAAGNDPLGETGGTMVGGMTGDGT